MKGFLFIRDGGFIGWRHASEVRPSATDCTEMDDISLQREVCKALGIFNFCRVWV